MLCFRIFISGKLFERTKPKGILNSELLSDGCFFSSFLKYLSIKIVPSGLILTFRLISSAEIKSSSIFFASRGIKEALTCKLEAFKNKSPVGS